MEFKILFEHWLYSPLSLCIIIIEYFINILNMVILEKSHLLLPNDVHKLLWNWAVMHFRWLFSALKVFFPIEETPLSRLDEKIGILPR